MNRSNIIGLLLFLSFFLQFISGLLISCYYSNNDSLCFNSIIHMLMNINYGYIMRILHVIGSSLFMFFFYSHYIRGYYIVHLLGIGNKMSAWIIGVLIMVLLLITGYIGYTLNWGQMSFWGVTVIVSIILSIRYIGNFITDVILPSYIIVVNRLFNLHYSIGYIILLLLMFHIIVLHGFSSINTIINSYCSFNIPFLLYSIIKDCDLINYFIQLFIIFLFYDHNILGNNDNNILANPFHTPNNILPEWYYLLYYCCLRSHSNKNAGVLIILALIWILFSY